MKCRSDFHDDGEYRDYLRTYFAAMAMQGLISARYSDAEGNVRHAVFQADALLKALETKTE